jgi:nicotinamide-nucleotide amidase
MGTYAETIAIGSELLNAGRADTNSVWIADRLAELGLRLRLKTCVGDDFGELGACLAAAAARAEAAAEGAGAMGLIVTTGGLGPTFDDRTKEAFAGALGAPMFEDAQTRLDIDAFFGARGRAATENNYGQALIPAGAVAMRNTLGTAPGVYWDAPAGRPRLRIVMLPGVPREMKAMWAADVHPRLLDLAEEPAKALRLVVGGVGESVLDERTRAVRERHSRLDWTILAHGMHIELLARSKSQEALEAARLDMEAELGQDLVCTGDGSPESTLLGLLAARGETLALAESVTGGLLASRLAAVPGASRALLGGAVAYAPKAKEALLGVGADLLASSGTVGEDVTLEMATRARKLLGATWALAVTGNAGPAPDPNARQGGGRDEAGRCYIAVAGADGAACRAHDLHGTRQDVQLRAANWAMDALRRRLAPASQKS